MSLPDRLIVRRYVARGFRTWLAVRLALAVVLSLAGGGVDGRSLLGLPLAAALEVIVLSAGLGLADVARRHERALLANLGVSSPQVLALFALPAAAAEVGAALLAPFLA